MKGWKSKLFQWAVVAVLVAVAVLRLYGLGIGTIAKGAKRKGSPDR